MHYETRRSQRILVEDENPQGSLLPQENATNSPDLAVRMKLGEALNTFKLNYTSDPTFLIRVLRNCILNEQKIFRLYEESLAQNASLLAGDPVLTILQNVEKSRRDGKQMEERIKQMHNLEEAFVFQYQELQKRNAQLQQLQASSQPIETVQRAQQEVMQYDNAIKERARELHLERLSFVENLSSKFVRKWVLHVSERQRPLTLTIRSKFRSSFKSNSSSRFRSKFSSGFRPTIRPSFMSKFRSSFRS